MSEGHSPLDQFKIHEFVHFGKTIYKDCPSLEAGQKITDGKVYSSTNEIVGECINTGYSLFGFTNSALFMVFSVVLMSFFLIAGMSKKSLVPGKWQMAVELSFEFVANMLKENVGTKARPYFPFVFSLFMFVLGCNLLGMFPYFNFTVTSHIAVTFAFAMFVFIAVTIIGFAKHGAGYLKMFMPEGVPLAMAPLMIPIEFMSYLVRPVTLSLRLAGNMMAGHVLLKVLAGFVISLGGFVGAEGMLSGDGVGIASITSAVPFVLLIAFVAFEFLVALLQAYIFSLLVSIYLNDALNMH